MKIHILQHDGYQDWQVVESGVVEVSEWSEKAIANAIGTWAGYDAEDLSDTFKSFCEEPISTSNYCSLMAEEMGYTVVKLISI